MAQGMRGISEGETAAIGCAVILAVVIGVPVLAWALLTGRISLPDDGNDSASAVVICQKFVKGALRYPDTADFTDSDPSQTGKLTWRVTGVVAAEGDLVGQKYRSRYVCEIEYQGDDEWELTEDIQLDQS